MYAHSCKVLYAYTSPIYSTATNEKYSNFRLYDNKLSSSVLLDFSLTVKAVPHECVIRTGLPKT